MDASGVERFSGVEEGKEGGSVVEECRMFCEVESVAEFTRGA